MSQKEARLKNPIFKYLIIGSNGLLGNEFKKILPKSKTMLLARKKSDCNTDLTDFKKLDKFFKRYKFNNVINCAGETNLELCEKNYQKCKKINTDLPNYLLKYSKKYNFKLTHVSTDHFFKNKKFKLNAETCKTSIINKYARTKLLAENFVRKNKVNLIVRTNFTGFKVKNLPSTFVGWILDSLKKKKKLLLFSDMYTSTIDVRSCVLIIKKLIDKNAMGIYNVGTKDAISKKDFAIFFAKKLKMKIDFEEISINTLPIKRGNYLGLNINKTQKKIKQKIINSSSAIKKLVLVARKIS